MTGFVQKNNDEWMANKNNRQGKKGRVDKEVGKITSNRENSRRIDQIA